MSKLLIVALSTLAFSATAFAEGDTSTHFSLDTDPSTFAFGGFSGWAMAKPAAARHLRVGVGGFGLDFPSFLVPHLNRTGEDGWRLNVRAAMAFVGYFIGERTGLYVGSYIGYLESQHTRADTMGEANEHNITVLPTVGYQWFPFSQTSSLHGVYVQPWAGATFWIPIGGTTTVGTHTFKDPHFIPIAALHLGYEF